MLGAPASTDYDLRFRMLGIPVRVQPWFWVVSAMLGASHAKIEQILIWVVCVFVSIIVHEFGHGLMAKAFGYAPTIVLYGMGGLCYSDGERQSPGQRLAVLICGPVAGFLLAGLIIGGYLAAGRPTLSATGTEVFNDMLFINIAWGIFNLMPVWPLDGGQITAVILTYFSPRHGMRRSHIVSLVAAALLAMLALRLNQIFIAVFLGLLAFQNYQILQSIHQQYAQYGGDDADWWKR
ncbi:MAG TPA: site-2 protease family protein [Isosphaeraceae bacterium]|nr:site-2 protease family protein [Isosphaeraceae bacterium]